VTVSGIPGKPAQPARQAGFQRSGLVADSVDAVQVADIKPAKRVTPHRPLGDGRGLVGRIIQDLDLEQILRIIHLADGVDEPVGDVHLVENRELHGDTRQCREFRRRQRRPILVFRVKIHEVVAVPSIDGQNAEHEKVKDENQRLNRRHKEMNPSRDTIDNITALPFARSTAPFRLQES